MDIFDWSLNIGLAAGFTTPARKQEVYLISRSQRRLANKKFTLLVEERKKVSSFTTLASTCNPPATSANSTTISTTTTPPPAAAKKFHSTTTPLHYYSTPLLLHSTTTPLSNMKIAIIALLMTVVAISHTSGAAIKPAPASKVDQLDEELIGLWTKALGSQERRQRREVDPMLPLKITARVLMSMNPVTGAIPLIKNIKQLANGEPLTIL